MTSARVVKFTISAVSGMACYIHVLKELAQRFQNFSYNRAALSRCSYTRTVLAKLSHGQATKKLYYMLAHTKNILILARADKCSRTHRSKYFCATLGGFMVYRIWHGLASSYISLTFIVRLAMYASCGSRKMMRSVSGLQVMRR